jgi:putative glutamine amidotransferase
MKIGLTHTGTEEKHQNYVRWLQSSPGVEVITLSAETQVDDEVFGSLDGIVISGGVDVHPAFYQMQTGYANQPDTFNEPRDRFETRLFEFSQAKHIPLLGVCRALQLINCILGGTLIQDIGETANAIHRFDVNDKAHGVSIIPNTLLHTIAGKERLVTNSAHHQAIGRLGNGLKVNCTSDDGLIEGIEWADSLNRSFFLAVQWHPERLFKCGLENGPLSRNIREYFIKAIEQSKKADL